MSNSSAFLANSASQATKEQFAASLILTALDGNPEELEDAWKVKIDDSKDVLTLVNLDSTLSEAIRGILLRLIKEDFQDNHTQSLCQAFNLASLNTKLDKRRRSERIAKQLEQSSAKTRRESDVLMIDGILFTQDTISDAIYTENTPKSGICEQRYNKIFIDILEAIIPATIEFAVLIDNDENKYMVNNKTICSSKLDGSVKVKGRVYAHVEVKVDNLDETQKRALNWQVGFEFLTLISSTYNDDQADKQIFKGNDDIFRYVMFKNCFSL